MGRPCSIVANTDVHMDMRKSQKESDHYGDLDVCGMIILRRILEEMDGVLCTGLISLTLGISGGLL
jgi:hypothetical protein